ncbi:MAG: hypothetical protein U9Q38_00140, partial [Thermodesulfobacteriota bacterium]|nr:hypothetical protein [Thermodesulfobacteriota bacterium]
ALFIPASLQRQYRRIEGIGIGVIIFLLITNSLSGLFSFIPRLMEFLIGSDGFHLFLVLIGAFK